MRKVIEVKDLAKKYNGLEAVKGISFDVEEGEVFGFLGPNGAGKTTTINMLCTLLRPSSGGAMLNGFNVTTEPNKVRQSLGIVFQDPSLDERLTARENLEFHGLIYNVPKREREKRIGQVLEMVELTQRQGSIVKTFSGGMKRRLEIARGLLHYPKVLFLDEPTLGLDPQTRSHIWEYLHELKKREKITIFLTTHYMDEAENCDRIAIIDYGEIIALDTPNALKKKVGGDVVIFRTKDDKSSARKVREEYGLSLDETAEGLRIEVENGEEFIPSFIKEFPIAIDFISLWKPTLDDVFLKLTGRAIREETIGPRERMRAIARMRRR